MELKLVDLKILEKEFQLKVVPKMKVSLAIPAIAIRGKDDLTDLAFIFHLSLVLVAQLN